MTRWILAAGLAIAIVVGATIWTPWLVALATEQRPDAGENEKSPVTSVGLRISRHLAFAGQPVQFRSVIDREADVEVGTVSFSVTRIGFFHRGLNKMVFSDDAIGTSVVPEEAFEGLSTRQGSHGLSWSHVSPIEKGFDGNFVGKKYGTFLITCFFGVRGDAGKRFHSNPVLIQVIPRTNPLSGRAAIEQACLWQEGVDGGQDFEELFDHARAQWGTVD